MGFFSRLRGELEERPRLRSAVLGSGPLSGRLAAAYEKTPGLELVAHEPLARAEEVIRIPGLRALELVAPVEKRGRLARDSIRAGLFTSLDAPAGVAELEELHDLSRAYQVPLRVRLMPLYYPPIRECRRLVKDDAVGDPVCLKLTVRRGRGAELPEPFEPAAWLFEHELGSLALAEWLMGPIAKVHARLAGKRDDGSTPSMVVSWKHESPHRYGYLQLDFCPGLQVRTWTEPIQRGLELTGLGGLIMVTRGEGQLLRVPALIVRGKSTTTAFEMVPDDWREADKTLARETVSVLTKKGRVTGSAAVALSALRLAESIKESHRRGDEVGHDPRAGL